MHSGWAVAVLALAGCSTPPNFAGLKPGKRTAHLEERIPAAVLPNGMRVAFVPDSRTNLVTVTVRYDVGGADDPPNAAGLAHYVEHVLWEAPFRAGDGPALRDIELEGNAVTRHDRTYFFATVLESDLERELEVVARRLQVTCNELDDAILARERDVVVEEVKQRMRPGWSDDRVAAAIWGGAHPYAHRVGSAEFATIAKPALCGFIDQHYAPASATLVVSGRVDDSATARITERFARIAPRPLARRDPGPPLGTTEARITVPGLERPTALMLFPAPGEGEPLDAAVSVLNGTTWFVNGYTCTTVVLGEERSRVVAVLAETHDTSDLSIVIDAMRKRFATLRIPQFELKKQRARLNFLDTYDDLFSATIHVADRFARHQPVSRLQRLHELNDLGEQDVVRLLDPSQARVLLLVPEGKTATPHHAEVIVTDLHDVEILRSPLPPSAATPLPAIPVSRELADYRLANGLRVWLAPDPAAIAIDARLVIAADAADDDRVAREAATLLNSETGVKGGWDSWETVKWYRTIGESVIPHVQAKATTFRISGFWLFGDWHVWNLAWTALHGRYPSAQARRRHDEHKPSKTERDKKQPSAMTVALHRLDGRGEEAPDRSWAPSEELETFRVHAHRPERSTLIVTGRFNVAAMRKEIETLFGDWRATGVAPASSASRRKPRVPGYVAIPVDDSPTVEIALAFAAPSEADRSEKAARAVLNEILNDRLRLVREGLGASYGVYAHVGTTGVVIGGSIEPEYVAHAAHAMVDQVAHVREGDDALAADFARARKRVLARELADPVGAAHRGAQLERIAIDGVPLDQPERDIEAIRALDLDMVRRLAARDLRPDRMIAAVRGAAASIDAAFGALGVRGAKIETIASRAAAK